jgi:hypothetical protein
MPSSKAILHDLAVHGLNPSHAHTKLVDGKLAPLEQVQTKPQSSTKSVLNTLPLVVKQEEIVPVKFISEVPLKQVAGEHSHQLDEAYMSVIEEPLPQVCEVLPVVTESVIEIPVIEIPVIEIPAKTEETVVIASSKKLRAKKAEKPVDKPTS